jgi:phage terminase large subunit-like protein
LSIRKSLDESHLKLTASLENVRAQQEAKTFALGIPLCPEQYAYNDRPLWALWKSLSKALLKLRKLSYSDGDALLSLAKAKKNGQKEIAEDIYNKTWRTRPRFPEPVVAGDSLTRFINQVADERATFTARLLPTETLMLDSDGGRYEPADGDATTVARKYALESLGSMDTGQDLKDACARWLKDTDDGHQRGIYWDPFAARNVIEYATKFGGLGNILPWEIWVLASTFAFKRSTGLRRFSEVWLSMGRKNGKTRFAATLATFMLTCDQEKYAEVYAASTAREQSRICWKDAKRLVGDSPELAAHVSRWAGELFVKDTDSRFLPLASEERSFLGVRASAIIADEVGVWTSRDSWDALVQSTVSRTQPLTVAITTAPAHRMTFAHEKFSWAEKILRGIVQADHVFAAIFRIDTGDDPKDIVKLRKANPSLGVTLREEHLTKQIAELNDTPSGLNNFLQFHANITPDRTLTRQGSIPPTKWDACKGYELIGESNPMLATTKFLALNTDTPCYVGIDIGMSSDTTCIAQIFPSARFSEGAEPINKMVVVVQCFMPEIGLLEKERTWGVPLSVWSREGWLQLTPGDICDLREIKKYIIDLNQQFRVMECGFDPWQFPVQAAELNEMGISCVAVPQVPSQLTAPCQELSSAVLRGDLIHFGNPCLAWMAGNVILVESEKHSGLRPEKLMPNEKIDGISAIISGWHRFLTNPPRRPFRVSFIMADNSVVRPDADGKLQQVFAPLEQKSEGAVNGDCN